MELPVSHAASYRLKPDGEFLLPAEVRFQVDSLRGCRLCPCVPEDSVDPEALRPNTESEGRARVQRVRWH